MLPRRLPQRLPPPPLRAPFARYVNYQSTSLIGAEERSSESSAANKRKGPPKGVQHRDPSDPTKVVSRAKVINFRPRGPTVVRGVNKTQGDGMGKMVREDPVLDINGIPERLPTVFYLRSPLLKIDPDSYEDWKKRGSAPKKLLEVAEEAIKQLELAVAKFSWERRLHARPPVPPETFESHKRIVDILDELRRRAVNANLLFKAQSYAKAIRSIASHPRPITNAKEISGLPGVGKKTAEKIQEIIDTGTLRRLTDDTEDKKAAALALFSRVPGIGHVFARELVSHGLYKLEDLKDLTDPELTQAQKLGLQYFEELEKKIPREEMTIWDATIRAAIEAVDVEFQSSLVGNYRRGALESDKIDVLVTHFNYTKTPDESYLQRIRQKFTNKGYIIGDIITEIDRYEGIAQLPAAIFRGSSAPPPLHRRIQFRLVPWQEFPFARLHYTGSEQFILYLRERAARMGYRLTSHELEKRTKTAVEVFGLDGLQFIEKDDGVEEGKSIELDSEEDIFRYLRMKYVPSYERNWY